MVKHWSGKFKGLDTGSEDYEIADEVWEQIWKETAEAVRHIPAQFVRVLQSTPSYFTAEAWCFWFVYLAPILLKGRFRDVKYYDHACQLGDIIKSCIALQFTYTEINQLQDNCIDWVQTYEKYYYQYKEERLSACPLTFHGLLHVPDDIRFCGPSSSTWTFLIERFCGVLQAGLRSRRHPWANLNNRVIRLAYLEQLGARYDLEEELSTHKHPEMILRAPYTRVNIPDALMRKRLAAYFAAVLKARCKDIQPLLPEVMPRWGKLRIVDGDYIRSMLACGLDPEEDKEREMSFVRYELQVQEDMGAWTNKVFYGRLEEILVCKLSTNKIWSNLAGKTRLLAVITPCATEGKDAARTVTFYTRMTQSIVTDLRTVVAVIGRAETRGEWGIIDRSGGLLHPTFNSP
ncbi:hypothetical protein C8F04DRAFT_962737 [Mycena alexandri]|uniref:Uncharacterized protein n=1 Tax=Mycena alexandri TaxID=1745969 RepID=A0AAD6SL07_9AGAR|nr:hypothetical protein C8F04DRAFT_962737 [Mycena alexandri]